jgi:pimeloyl-ACP methyl ester carboxylesterase
MPLRDEPAVGRSSERHRAVSRRCLGVLLAFGVLSGGCMFRDLDRNLRARERYGILQGTVRGTAAMPAGGTIVVVAFTGGDDDPQVVDSIVLPQPGRYFLLVPVGSYRVAAFEDRNGDRVRDPSEPLGQLSGGQLITVPSGQAVQGLDLTLEGDGGPLLAVPPEAAVGVDALPHPHLGEVVSLNDRRFSEQAAQDGLWRPVEFLFDTGAGLFFLEPYDPDRIPVIFVHGALGHPGNWRPLIERLDRDRFQPWVVYYPTAARLDIIAAAIHQWLQTLNATYRFRPPVLVAHSMGGLIVRSLLNQHLAEGAIPAPIVFITLSTPWLGHAAAARGVAQAPVVAPSWYDMAPGSPFLTQLLERPLPSTVSHTLLFSYGGASRWIPGANDGVVTLASELAPAAQQHAAKVRGFDVDHRGIMDSPAVAAEVNSTLAAIPE